MCSDLTEGDSTKVKAIKLRQFGLGTYLDHIKMQSSTKNS